MGFEAQTTRMKSRIPLYFLLLTSYFLVAQPGFAVRIKDVTQVEGIRDNSLIGYGLVVGLNGTGDGASTEFTVRTLVSFLRRSGVTLDPDTIKVKNVAAVVVTADLPPFGRPGSRIDVTVSSIGDADNLQGGTLLMTSLQAVDGQVYALAQGAISIGGFDAGAQGTSVSKNHTTAGKIPGGALIERAPPTRLEGLTTLNLILNNPDFTTAGRVAEVINRHLGAAAARAKDSSNISVEVPAMWRANPASFLAEIERLPVHPDQRARVVIDERTGTVVMGEDVRISTMAIAHGSLSIQVTTSKGVSQPGPFSQGQTAAVNTADVGVFEEAGDLRVVPEGVSLGEVVHSLNAIGVTPRDLIAILQTIKASGALQAELVIQ
jgi:flagellar P-ring protein precursor FlgI